MWSGTVGRWITGSLMPVLIGCCCSARDTGKGARLCAALLHGITLTARTTTKLSHHNCLLAAGWRGAGGHSGAQERQQGRRRRQGAGPRRWPRRRPGRLPAARAAGGRWRKRQGRARRQGWRRPQDDCAGERCSRLWWQEEAVKKVNARCEPSLFPACLEVACMRHSRTTTGCDAQLHLKRAKASRDVGRCELRQTHRRGGVGETGGRRHTFGH